MPRLSFTLRDVFWLTLVVGMGCAWAADRYRLSRQFKDTINALHEERGDHRWPESYFRTSGKQPVGQP